MKTETRENFKKMYEEAIDVKEALYLVAREYYYIQYEYMAFEKMLQMKWALVS